MKLHRMPWQGAFRFAMTKFANRKIDFVIAGTIKGGTTALDAYLRLHPQIGMSSIKEIRFFDNENYFYDGRRPYQAYQKIFGDVWLRQVLGDATPSYMYAPKAPQRIFEYNPRMKFVMLLREPVSRAYSHWNMERQMNKDPRTFGDAIRQELSAGVENLAAQSGFAYVHRGVYSEQLERIWRLFPREQTLVLKSEELRNNHIETLNRIYRFLGVSAAKEIASFERHARSYKEPLSPQDKRLLQEVFHPEIKKLEQLLNWNCSDWLMD